VGEFGYWFLVWAATTIILVKSGLEGWDVFWMVILFFIIAEVLNQGVFHFGKKWKDK
jgi:hypothetical protein